MQIQGTSKVSSQDEEIKSESLRIGTKALAMQNEKGNTGSMCEAGWNTLDLQI